VRLYGVTGWKNTGKTTLVTRLVGVFTARGLSVSTVKHAHHRVDIDRPGADSFRHREAGAREVILASRHRFALMREIGEAPEPPLAELLALLQPVDLVLVEGYKRDAHPKVEAHRAEAGRPLLAPEDPTVRAVASDTALTDLRVPLFRLDDAEGVADFIARELAL